MRSFIKQTIGFMGILMACSAGHSLVLSNDVIKASEDILSLTQSQGFQATNCQTTLSDLNKSLYAIKSDHFINMTAVSEVNQQDAISRLFESRMQLNYRLRDFVSGKKFQSRAELEACANEMRKSLKR